MASVPAYLVPPPVLPTRERGLRPSTVRPSVVAPPSPVATAAASPSDRPRDGNGGRDRGRPYRRGGRADGRSRDTTAYRHHRRATMSAPPVQRVSDVLMGSGVAVAGVAVATAMSGAADAIHSLPAVGDSFELVGAAYTLWFMRRFLSSSLGRQELATTLRSISPPPGSASASRRSASAPPPRRSSRSRSTSQQATSPMATKTDGVGSTQPVAAAAGQAPFVAAGSGVFVTSGSGSNSPSSAVSRAARAEEARMAVRARRAPNAEAPETVTLKPSVPGQSAVSLFMQAPVRTPLFVGSGGTDGGTEMDTGNANQKRSVADRVLAPFRSRTQPDSAAVPPPIVMAPVSQTVPEEIVSKYRGWRFVRKRTLPKPVGMYSTQEGQPRTAVAAATTSLFVTSGLNWGGWRSNNVALAPARTLTAQSNTAVSTGAELAGAVLPAATASAAAAYADAAASAAAGFNAAAVEAMASFPSAAREAAAGIPAAATKAAATASKTFSNGDMSFGGWRFAGFSKSRHEAMSEAQSMSALPTKKATAPGAVQLSAAAAVAKVKQEAASRPPAPKPHRPWSRSEWLSFTKASQEKAVSSTPANAYVTPGTRRRGGRMDRTKLPTVTKPYENEFLVREI
ncbi:hypothetical protein MMPV_009112 [Pyropia vietnamensis]